MQVIYLCQWLRYGFLEILVKYEMEEAAVFLDEFLHRLEGGLLLGLGVFRIVLYDLADSIIVAFLKRAVILNHLLNGFVEFLEGSVAFPGHVEQHPLDRPFGVHIRCSYWLAVLVVECIILRIVEDGVTSA